MQAAGALQPHLILSNIHNYELFSPAAIRHIRQAAPGAIWLNWIGDVWPKYHIAPEWLAVWREMDGLLVVNADMIEPCANRGIKAYYWQSGPEENDGDLDVPAHDVVFQGNGHRRPAANGFRTHLYDALNELRDEGIDVGIYGENEEDKRVTGNTFWQFDKTQALNKKAKLVVSDNEFGATGYTSKRFFDIMVMGGGMILHQETPGFDKLLHVKDGTHYVSWTDYEDLKAKIRFWLNPKKDKRRRQIARNARRVCEKYHTYPMRMKELLTEIIPQAAKEAVKVHG